MMQNLVIVLERIKDAISEARREDGLNAAEKAGLYSGVRIMCDDLDAFINEDLDEDGYALEKVGQIKWHMGAALGFDVTNGHNSEMHRVWALGALDSLESRISQLSSTTPSE